VPRGRCGGCEEEEGGQVWEDGSAEPTASCLCVASWLFPCRSAVTNRLVLCQPRAGSVPGPARTLWVCLMPCHPALPPRLPPVAIARSAWEGRAPASLSPLSCAGRCFCRGCCLRGVYVECGALGGARSENGLGWKGPLEVT